jgi:hypothetical protein
MEKGTFILCWFECKLIKPLWEILWRLLTKLKKDLPCDSAKALLGIYPMECYSEDTCTPMFTAVLFIITKLWKQKTCPTTDEWIKKMWYLYTMEFYSAQKNEILSLAHKWLKL